MGVGSDVAMAFMEGDDPTPTVHFGRVQACFSKVRGVDEVLDWPVSLVDAPDSLSLECSWFYPHGRRSANKYTLGIRNGVLEPDQLRYPITAFVGLVDMDEVLTRGKTFFKPKDNGQLNRFKNKAQHMSPVAVTVARHKFLLQQQKQREEGTYYRTFNDTR